MGRIVAAVCEVRGMGVSMYGGVVEGIYVGDVEPSAIGLFYCKYSCN